MPTPFKPIDQIYITCMVQITGRQHTSHTCGTLRIGTPLTAYGDSKPQNGADSLDKLAFNLIA